jgi:hypothetical protein
VVDDVRELRDREALADRRQSGDGRVDAAASLRAVALDAPELDERVRAGGDGGRDLRLPDDRRRARPGDLRRDGRRLLAVVACRVGDGADCDRERYPRADHGRQDPGLAPRAPVVRHTRILHLAPAARQCVLAR